MVVPSATLWTDFLLDGPGWRPLYMEAAASLMLDYRIIRRPDGRATTPEDTIARHRASALWLSERLSRPFSGRTVMATHHAPSHGSIVPRYENSALNGAFVNDMSALMEGPQAPDLWVHGHVHTAVDYSVGRTRVVCNPLGYLGRADERLNGFRWGKIVEI